MPGENSSSYLRHRGYALGLKLGGLQLGMLFVAKFIMGISATMSTGEETMLYPTSG